jgi:hypothetical protein
VVGVSAHQRYLEAPYERQAALDAHFEEWCEAEGKDVDDEYAYEEFEAYCDDWLD